MKNVLARNPFSIFAVVLVGLLAAVSAFVLAPPSFSESATAADVTADAQADQPDGTVNVTQHHNDDSRDGLFVDPAFTLANATNLTRDLSFSGVISGNVYMQPLYIENGPGNQAMIIVGTNSNNLYALNATDGTVIWSRLAATIGTPGTGLPCGNVVPEGILGTPVVDLATRSLYFNALTLPSAGVFRQMIYSVNVDTGVTNAGWPVSVEGLASNGGGGITFTSNVQGERGAAVIVGGRVYFPYGGRFGDCGTYHGWTVGVNMSNPADVQGWANTARGGGAWSPGGLSSDGTNVFMATGNTFSTGGIWGGGEAIIRLQSGPIFSNTPTDYWAPTNWLTLDNGDTDLGGTGAMMVDVPGATPSELIVAMGKDRNAYVLNRNNLGGISAPVAQANSVGGGALIQAPATYRTSLGTWVVFRASSTTVGSFRINPTNPPTITTTWSVSQSGRGSPFVTTTDGTNNAIVWVVGAEGSQRLMGYNGDTGAVVYNGGGANELMTATRRFNTGIAARGRIYIAADNRVYAFKLPDGASPTPTNTPTNTATNTPTAAPTSDALISGTVTYANATAPPIFVSNVLISGAGSPNVSTTTASPGPIAGNYALAGFGAGSYTVTPTKTSGANGISSFDSARVAQHVAGVTVLTANQQIAGDASDNGVLSSFDAAQIAQYVVNGTGGHTTEWKFLPANRFYPSVPSPISGQDYSAILVGEVSGNWANTGARAVMDDSVQATVELPVLQTEPDKEIIVPITVSGAANKGVISYEFDLRYDPSVLRPAIDALDTKATSSRGLIYLTNSQEPGLLRVIMYGPMPISEDGVLVNLKFTAVGAPGSVSALSFERIMFNEGEPRVNTSGGQIYIGALTK